MDLGRFVEHEGRPAVQLERTFRQPAELLWPSVSEPDLMGGWFPSTVRMDPRPGGTVTFSGDPNMPASEGQVLGYEPPQRLSFSWGGDELHLSVAPEGTGSRLVLVNVLEATDTAARNAAGWAVCLTALEASLSGLPPPAMDWRALYDAHVAAGLPSGAPLPGHDQEG